MLGRHRDVAVTQTDGTVVKFRLLVTPPPQGYGPEDDVQGFVIDEKGAHELTTVKAKQIQPRSTDE